MKIINYFFEFVLILFIILGLNFYKIKPEYSNYANIFSAILLLIWLIGMALSEDKFRFQKLPIPLILIRVLTPIVSIVLTLIFYEKPLERTPKKPIELNQISDYSDCSKIKYGTFTHDLDTLIRISISNVDYEIHNRTDSFLVTWISDCSYRINKNEQFEIYNIREVTDYLITLERINTKLNKDIVLQSRIY